MGGVSKWRIRAFKAQNILVTLAHERNRGGVAGQDHVGRARHVLEVDSGRDPRTALERLDLVSASRGNGIRGRDVALRADNVGPRVSAGTHALVVDAPESGARAERVRLKRRDR